MIPIRQKIGVCGRSGSGKSTLLMALVRTTKISSGELTFGRKNIDSIRLEVLRQNVVALPQVPMVFSILNAFFLQSYIVLFKGNYQKLKKLSFRNIIFMAIEKKVKAGKCKIFQIVLTSKQISTNFFDRVKFKITSVLHPIMLSL